MPESTVNNRQHIAVRGVVQGIGFRPFVYRLARELSLTGWISNDTVGAIIEIQGNRVGRESFLSRLRNELPPAGRIDDLAVKDILSETAEKAFTIKKSLSLTGHSVSLVPDRATCHQCIEEMRTLDDRRHRYPFVNCTHCGPRYTIVEALPYDRPNTTMHSFPMCDECRGEYENPEDRRYHAQPIACPACGPQCLFVEPKVRYQDLSFAGVRDSVSQIRRAIECLMNGKTVAIKGIGGFHLVADATSHGAINRLRRIKHRNRKPLAIMVKNVVVAQKIVILDDAGIDLLTSPAAPIVIAPRQKNCSLPQSLAPGIGELGVMLPYSPLHHLLFEPLLESQQGLEALIVTSGNSPSEPITTSNRHALKNLNADAYLMHNRDIHVPSDDSVIRNSSPAPVFLRRSRGYVPDTLDAEFLPKRQVLALGAELKVTVSTLKEGRLSVGRHLGDMDNRAIEDEFIAEINRILSFEKVSPEAIAVDAHPDVFSAVFARQTFSSLPISRVQHHHAHFAAALVEHKMGPEERAVGIILDGFGYGSDHSIWGGEVLLGHLGSSSRVGHIRPFPQPGGDHGARYPGRMATSLLLEAGLEDRWSGFDSQIASICRVRAVSPLTSSAGRLIDGAAALIGVAPNEQEYEAEAALLLEAIADPECQDAYPFPLSRNQLDFRELIGALLEDNADSPIKAARFLNGVADGFVAMALETGAKTVVLSGGCMANRILMKRFIKSITHHGARAIWPKVLPPGDGGLSAGQAACVAWRLESGDL